MTLLGIALVWMIWTGKFNLNGPGKPITRKEQPITYWLLISVFAALWGYIAWGRLQP